MSKYKSSKSTAYRKPVVLDSNDPRNKSAFELEKFRSRIGAQVIVKDSNNPSIELEEYSPKKGEFIYAEYNDENEIHITLDSGKSWSIIYPGAFGPSSWHPSPMKASNYLIYAVNSYDEETSSDIFGILVSTDSGNTWEPYYSSVDPNGETFCGIFANETITFIQTDPNNYFNRQIVQSTSLSPLTWTKEIVLDGWIEDFSSIAYANGQYVATTRGTGLFTSTDGLNWEYTSDVFSTISESYGQFRTILYNKNMFLSYAEHALSIEKSIDGVNWESISLPFSIYAGSMAFSDNVFIFSGMNTSYVTSTNGTDWVERLIPDGETTFHVSFDANSKIFLGQGNLGVYSSSDGISWKKESDLYLWIASSKISSMTYNKIDIFYID